MVACNFSVEPIPSQCSRVIFSKWKMGTFAKNALNSCLMRIVLSLLKPWLLKESSSVTLPLPFALIHVSGLILIIRKFEKYHMQSFPKEIKNSLAFLRLPPVKFYHISFLCLSSVKCLSSVEKNGSWVVSYYVILPVGFLYLVVKNITTRQISTAGNPLC